jgi:N-acetylglucosaminyldiphosphoundecaprenol N-acetyl-beta-D-mannosaminyltransferase
VNAFSTDDLNRIVARTIASSEQAVIGNHNLHSLYLFYSNAVMRSFFEIAKYVHVDGMSFVLLAKLLGQPISRNERTGYMDWLPSLMEKARENRWRVFYLGSRPDILEKGIEEIKRRWPGIEIEGHHGYFNKAKSHEESESVVKTVQAYAPNILMVGMGMPVQERWIFENRAELNANVVLACGALIDYVAGAIPLPPRWLGQLGLEWLFRLVTEPRRLWRRYLLEPMMLLGIVLRRREDRFTDH